MVGFKGEDMKQWSEEWRRSFWFSMSMIHLSLFLFVYIPDISSGIMDDYLWALNKPNETMLFL